MVKGAGHACIQAIIHFYLHFIYGALSNMHDKTNYKLQDPRDFSKGIMVAQDIKLNIKCSPKQVSFECFHPSLMCLGREFQRKVKKVLSL